MGLFPFANEALLDFEAAGEQARMQAAVAVVGQQLGQRYPHIIGGDTVASARYASSLNPAEPDQVIGEYALGTAEDVDRAVAAARSAFTRWSRVPVWDRAAWLLRAGDILRQRRRELLAWVAYEVGKNFYQGDGEVAEAIDHFEWNARLIQEWMAGRSIQPLKTEFNDYRYRPLGVGVVIAPWNFPTTLPLGMILAAIAAGNAVVFKPAEEATIIAHQILRVLTDAGLPAGVVNLVSGEGEVIGPRLVTHPDVSFVAFVGSRQVGTRIYEEASGVVPGQSGLRRVMTEMGGKNATIIADDADLDWALDEVAASAFGYQGQKCSATSRLLVMPAIYDQVLAGLGERAQTWRKHAGDATRNALFGPLISQSARDRVLGYVRERPPQSTLVAGGGVIERDGFFVEPTVVADVPPDSTLFREEIFGPVLSVTRASSFDAALEMANDSDYALTGAVFSRSPERLSQARDQFDVGNLYLNRSSTGAMAGVHPFGGYRFSGTGPKVGGPDYLGFFLKAQTVTEKVRY